jgi:hypothetical protein
MLTPPVSWLSGNFRAAPSHVGQRKFHQSAKWRGSQKAAYSRAAATALHRLPVRGVSSDCEPAAEAQMQMRWATGVRFN